MNSEDVAAVLYVAKKDQVAGLGIGNMVICEGTVRVYTDNGGIFVKLALKNAPRWTNACLPYDGIDLDDFIRG